MSLEKGSSVMSFVDEKERKAIHNTLYGRSDQTSAEQPGGRFEGVSKPLKGGVDPYPTLPPNSPWASDPVPPEPPLGLEGLECSNFYGVALGERHELGPDGVSLPKVHGQAQPPEDGSLRVVGEGGPSPVLEPAVEMALSTYIKPTLKRRRIGE